MPHGYQTQAPPSALEQGQDRRSESIHSSFERSGRFEFARNGNNLRDLALSSLAIDSKLRACDLLNLRVADIAHELKVSCRAVVMQRKTRRPMQFEITECSQTDQDWQLRDGYPEGVANLPVRR